MDKCPSCGSKNVVGVKGEWKCFDCGYIALVTTSSLILTNILGPIEVKVVSATDIYAILSLESETPLKD